MIAPELKVDIKLNFESARRGQKKAVIGERPKPPVLAPGSIPRVTRLMALAIRIEQLIRDGEIDDYAEIARLAHVTRARVTQIMNLLLLAPDIQNAILHLPRTTQGRDAVTERELRSLTKIVDWRKQRKSWTNLQNPHES